ncbi:methyl-accepting chemotaxis protein [Sulfitobacter mediterraneus]|uniref:methyl-accepting chemotaxis protein n=1 Tax=Sulfitobacter mediterraneus TaxID=83219 RepID=UPI0021A51135|nr:methyl-accepting chemotaxis protein [Sulfitobacter mediterraneus]UWR09738.1 chemotaxis protein [Sulfitobacter mediterraneus]
MTAQIPIDATGRMDKLAKAAAALGFEIVDIAGFLDLADNHAKHQRSALDALGASAKEVTNVNDEMGALVDALTITSDQALSDVKTSVALVRDVGDRTRNVAGWVKSVRDRTGSVGDTLNAVKANNSEIAVIAAQVNTLAINAKIEAARAGDAGRGFAVVADAINDLSQKTSVAATQISQNIENLTSWISDLGREAKNAADNATDVLGKSEETDTALSRMEATIESEHAQTQKISSRTQRVKDAMRRLTPAVREIDSTVREATTGIAKTNTRMLNVIETSEQIVQHSAALGGASIDAPFITFVQQTARDVSSAFDQALTEGKIRPEHLFDRSYRPVPNTNPEQVLTQATEFLDQLLPDFQEPAFQFDRRVVFCAAVDTNGYLPTHNLKFSHPQGDDPVWNTANSRNRRIFDDRVGLKAGRNTENFLLQVYRRDMGGGEFKLMKDLSAPIYAGGRHWGGLRLAYGY